MSDGIRIHHIDPEIIDLRGLDDSPDEEKETPRHRVPTPATEEEFDSDDSTDSLEHALIDRAIRESQMTAQPQASEGQHREGGEDRSANIVPTTIPLIGPTSRHTDLSEPLTGMRWNS
jgi:hypothetical protein